MGNYVALLLFTKCCHLVVIGCLDLDLAFDMFQSLNATGTPLTAFEVFKPAIVKTWGAGYTTGIKVQVDRIEAAFETETDASAKEDLSDKVIVSAALVYNGEAISNKFSDERDYLFRTLPDTPNAASIAFVTRDGKKTA